MSEPHVSMEENVTKNFKFKNLSETHVTMEENVNQNNKEETGTQNNKEETGTQNNKEEAGNNENNTEEEEYAHPDSDQVIEAIGDWGRWQMYYFILLGIFVMPVAWPVLWMTFMNAKQDYWCAMPESALASNMSIEEWKKVSGQTEDSCSILDRDWEAYDWEAYDWEAWGKNRVMDDNSNTTMISCTEWEYGTSQFTNTVTSQWNLVCDRSWLKSSLQSLYFVGTISGDFTFGIIADVIGRKLVISPLLLVLSITGTLAAFVPTLSGFITVRFFNAMADMGIFSTMICWLMEVVGGIWRTNIGIGIEFFWVLGWLILAAFGYLIKDWRYVMLAISVPCFSSVILFWLFPESPKWLIATGRISEAEAVVRKAAKVNGRQLPENWRLKKIKKVEEQKWFTKIFDLLRYPNLQTKTLILWFAWFANAFSYFGLSMNIGSLGGNVFVTFTTNGLLEIPAICAALFFARKKGRRKPFAGSMIACGLSLLCIMFIPREYSSLAVALSLFGKFCITFSFALAFLWTTEIFPTELRTTGIGMCSTVGRVGGILAPFVGDLGDKFHPYIPVLVFGTASLVAGLISLKLPETMGEKLPDTVEESEAFEIRQFPGFWQSPRFRLSRFTYWKKKEKNGGQV